MLLKTRKKLYETNSCFFQLFFNILKQRPHLLQMFSSAQFNHSILCMVKPPRRFNKHIGPFEHAVQLRVVEDSWGGGFKQPRPLCVLQMAPHTVPHRLYTALRSFISSDESLPPNASSPSELC